MLLDTEHIIDAQEIAIRPSPYLLPCKPFYIPLTPLNPMWFVERTGTLMGRPVRYCQLCVERIFPPVFIHPSVQLANMTEHLPGDRLRNWELSRACKLSLNTDLKKKEQIHLEKNRRDSSPVQMFLFSTLTMKVPPKSISF